ncbi:hypothetical protein GCM10027589_43850 [Actinocorallia lasiicapitis]
MVKISSPNAIRITSGSIAQRRPIPEHTPASSRPSLDLASLSDVMASSSRAPAQRTIRDTPEPTLILDRGAPLMRKPPGGVTIRA